MQGQANHFVVYAPEKMWVNLRVYPLYSRSPYAQNRYLIETKRLYSVLDSRLKGREFLVGAGSGKYALADIKTFGWSACIVSDQALTSIPGYALLGILELISTRFPTSRFVSFP